MSRTYDIAAYFWPAYHDESRWRLFMPDGEGEWETIRKARPKFEGHYQPRVPLWGYTSESNPREMERKIDAATSHGVNVFIFDWYWYDNQAFLEDALNEGFLKASNNDKMRFYLMWANHDASTSWDLERSHERKVIWPGAVNQEVFDAITDRIISQYFPHPSYYKIDGKPVFSIYEIKTMIDGLGGIKEARQALDAFRLKVKKAGFPGLHLQAILWNAVPRTRRFHSKFWSRARTQNNTLLNLGFDSFTLYQWVHIMAPTVGYEEWAEHVISRWEEWSKKFEIPFFPHVSIGWDTNPRFKELKALITGNTPELFGKYMERAMDFIDQKNIDPPLITVNSWNEWGEGSYLEPDTKYKMAYLEAVKNAIERKRE